MVLVLFLIAYTKIFTYLFNKIEKYKFLTT